MRAFIRRLLPYIARLHPKNWMNGRWQYPQLWYCLPSRWKTDKSSSIHCFCCGKPIKGEPHAGQGQPGLAPKYWCAACVNTPAYYDQYSLEIPAENKANPAKPRRPALIGYWMRPLLQKICGWMTGHEPSRTEWGYGGGKFVDRNCRWCDQLLQVPIAEDPPPNDLLAGLASKM